MNFSSKKLEKCPRVLGFAWNLNGGERSGWRSHLGYQWSRRLLGGVSRFDLAAGCSLDMSPAVSRVQRTRKMEGKGSPTSQGQCEAQRRTYGDGNGELCGRRLELGLQRQLWLKRGWHKALGLREGVGAHKLGLYRGAGLARKPRIAAYGAGLRTDRVRLGHY